MAGRPPGQKKTGGRKKGSLNKTTAEVKQMLLGSLNQLGGEKFFVKLGKEHPAVYASLLGKLIPREVVAEVNNSDALIQRILGARDRAQAATR